MTGEGWGRVRAKRRGMRILPTSSCPGPLETLRADRHYSTARGTLAGCQENPRPPLAHTALHKPIHFHTSDPRVNTEGATWG